MWYVLYTGTDDLTVGKKKPLRGFVCEHFLYWRTKVGSLRPVMGKLFLGAGQKKNLAGHNDLL